jgi:hypothetical protein
VRSAAPFLPEQSAARRGYYVTSMDRIGLALGVAGLGGGLVTAVLLALGGTAAIAALAIGALLGAVSGMVAALVLLGPVWALLHRAHRRGPIVAALAAGGVAAILLLAVRAPLLTPGGAGLILAAAATGVAMQHVAYRRIL